MQLIRSVLKRITKLKSSWQQCREGNTMRVVLASMLKLVDTDSSNDNNRGLSRIAQARMQYVAPMEHSLPGQRIRAEHKNAGAARTAPRGTSTLARTPTDQRTNNKTKEHEAGQGRKRGDLETSNASYQAENSKAGRHKRHGGRRHGVYEKLKK